MTSQKKKHLIFVCSGNYYRSRLAEILFNHEASLAKIDWVASSRGLLEKADLAGLSVHAKHYLKTNNLEHLAENPRNSIPMSVEELTTADLIIPLCRTEHQPMMEQKFLALAKAMHKSGRIRYWNIYDIPLRPRILSRLLGGNEKRASQPPDSSTDHIALAVRNLVHELSSQKFGK